MLAKPSQKYMPSKITKAEPLKPVQIYLPEQLWRRVRALANLRGMQAKELVSLVLADYLKNNKAA